MGREIKDAGLNPKEVGGDYDLVQDGGLILLKKRS